MLKNQFVFWPNGVQRTTKYDRLFLEISTTNLTEYKTIFREKYRLRCYKTVKDIENAMYSLNEAQKGIQGKPPKQKEIQKIQDTLKHLQPLLEKSETKYHKACGSVELARQDWQTAMIKGCEQLQTIDEQRITQLNILLKRYTHQVGESSKKVAKMHDALQKIDINVCTDIELAAKKYGSYPNVHEIYLFDIYSENTKNMMNRERRIANLNKWSLILNTDIQSQIKCIEGKLNLLSLGLWI
jgi:hypothetical protein